MVKYIKYTIFVVITTLVLAELVLRLQGNMRVYSEISGQGYVSPFEPQPAWYRHWSAGDTFTVHNPEFTYHYDINSDGFRDKNYPQQKSDSTIRILVTGDSFAEGVGAPYDSTWPRLLEKYLNEKQMHVEVIDAGISGNDIIFDYVFYRDILKKYNPDLVIGSMNCGDYTDYYFRGGMERFAPGGTVYGVKPPVTEYFFRYSHLFRAVYGKLNHPVKGIYLNESEYLQFLKKANQAYANAISSYNAETHKNGSAFLCLLYAMPTEIVYKTGVNDSIEKSYMHLGQMLNKQAVPCLVISDGLNSELGNKPESYYAHVHDGHYNATGYSVFARLVADSLLSRHALRMQTQTGKK